MTTSAPPSSVTKLQIEAFNFPPSVKAPGSTKTFFLGGAGVRGLEIQGNFVKFTAIGVYLEDNAVSSLAGKWRGKSCEELTESGEFFTDIVKGPFEKFMQVTMILPLTGQMYSEKVAENCVAYWKAAGTYTDDEAKAVEKFIEVFKNENFPPGSSILFTQSPLGSLTISFSKHEDIPAEGKIVIENKQLSEAVLESMIGKHGVSPGAKQSLAARLSEYLKEKDAKVVPNGKLSTELKIEAFTFPPLVKPPGSSNTLFLGGAGVRGLEIQGNFVKFTTIGVYLEDKAISSLSKWKGKSAEELLESGDFFMDIVKGPFEKFTQVTMILPLTGQMYSEKVVENCVAYWKATGTYSDDEAKAIDKFIEVFKNENFPPGSSILFTQSPSGSLTITFSKHEDIPAEGKVVIENKQLSEAVLESIIGKHGVSPTAKQTLAERVSEILNA